MCRTSFDVRKAENDLENSVHDKVEFKRILNTSDIRSVVIQFLLSIDKNSHVRECRFNITITT